MYISAISPTSGNLSLNNKSLKKCKKLSFHGLFGAMQLERSIKKNYGIECKFGLNSFVGECVESTTKLFDDLFGRKSLPNVAEYTSFKKKFDENTNCLVAANRKLFAYICSRVCA